MTKSEAWDIVVKEAAAVDDVMMDKGAALSRLLGTVYGCMACLTEDPEEDDRK